MGLSQKQFQILTFPKTTYQALICDGAVRSGKTSIMGVSFIHWAMSEFQNCTFGICGKTVQSAERNIINPLRTVRYFPKNGYHLKWNRTDKLLTVTRGKRVNRFYVFGGKDESSYTLIQGITLAGVLLDEVALMPQSFVDQALARCSVDGARFWFNCNPESPAHWFYEEWVQHPEKHNAMHLHFLMTDNPSLSAETLARYESLYSGVFYDRYIRGLWTVAEGAIYRQFAEHKADYIRKLGKDALRDVQFVSIGIDFGGSQSLTTFVATALHMGFRKVTVVADHHIKAPKGEIDADRLCRESNQHNERRYEFYWGYKSHVLVDCISGLPLYELTTPANVVDSAVVQEILAAANNILPLRECTFLGDKGYDVKAVYNLVKDVYQGEAVIPLNKRNTKSPEKLPVGSPICDAGLAMHKDGKTTDSGRTRQKFCCPFRQSKTGVCPCGHKNWNNGKKNRGCTKYKTIPSDYRLSIDRSCLSFKRTYALRTECERYNSRFKASGQERLWVRNGASAANLNTLAHISALAVALAAVLSGSHSYRSVKLLRRSA